ncbi:response regulator [Clostridium sp. D2Q-14]|uniref:response regulator n=1 Tax=Anaeromonas gelatinilytica TaxID=2683194 RepID=UPI00193B5E03|nr:response regulator [Anaeromonas gelatinilytica]MBS4534910.1 response regulator [Anaeromonas gelatinilytica]
MDIFIIEDDLNIIKSLSYIIKDNALGNVIGSAITGKTGLKKIKELIPDIVLVDYLLPEIDGVTLVNELKNIFPNISFIMISHVNSKDMIAKAYKSGIEYYINKPLNVIEIESIINKVKSNIEKEKKLTYIKDLIESQSFPINQSINCEECLKKVLYKLGIVGENGANDIIITVTYIMKNDINANDFSLKDICSIYSSNPKSMEQRMRRTAYLALSNIANIGLEDFMNDIFMDYSNSLFNFEQVRIEMNYLKGKSPKKGKVNLKKFLYGLTYYCENN